MVLTDNSGVGFDSINYTHPVMVLAVADLPQVMTNDAMGDEGDPIPLVITAITSMDNDPDDDSETLSVRLTPPIDAMNNTFGSLQVPGTTPDNITVTFGGNGVFIVTASGPDPQTREDRLNAFLMMGGIEYIPPTGFVGNLTDSTTGILVEVISTEDAMGGDLAPPNDVGNGTLGDRKSTRLNSSHMSESRMPSSA